MRGRVPLTIYIFRALLSRLGYNYPVNNFCVYTLVSQLFCSFHTDLGKKITYPKYRDMWRK